MKFKVLTKRLMFTLLSALLVFSFTGCGSDADSKESAKNESSKDKKDSKKDSDKDSKKDKKNDKKDDDDDYEFDYDFDTDFEDDTDDYIEFSDEDYSFEAVFGKSEEELNDERAAYLAESDRLYHEYQEAMNATEERDENGAVNYVLDGVTISYYGEPEVQFVTFDEGKSIMFRTTDGKSYLFVEQYDNDYINDGAKKIKGKGNECTDANGNTYWTADGGDKGLLFTYGDKDHFFIMTVDGDISINDVEFSK